MSVDRVTLRLPPVSRKATKGKLIILTHGFSGEPTRWNFLIDYLKGKWTRTEYLGMICDGIVTRKNIIISKPGYISDFKAETKQYLDAGTNVIFTIKFDKNETFLGSLKNLAVELSTDIRAIQPTGYKTTLIGHSLGGLVNLAYATCFYALIGYNNDNFDKTEKIISFNTPYNGSDLGHFTMNDALKPNSGTQIDLAYAWNAYLRQGTAPTNIVTAIGSISQPASEYSERPSGTLIKLKANDIYVNIDSQLGQEPTNVYNGFYKTIFARNSGATKDMNVSHDNIIYTSDMLTHTEITNSSDVLDYLIKIL